MNQSKYIFSTILAGAMWGCISIFLKGLYGAGFSQLQVMFFRAALSALTMLIFILIKDPSMLKIKLKDLWIFLGSGVVSLTFFTLCYFRSILELGASIGVILLYTSPIFVLIFSTFLFKERITVTKTIALLMTFAGCILVTGLGSSNAISVKGFLIGLGAGIGYALYSIFGRYALERYKQPTLLFYTFFFSSLAMIPFTSFENLDQLFTVTTSLKTAGIALFCTVLPYAFYTYGLSGLENGKAAIFVTVEPLVGSLVGIFLFKENVTVLKIGGIAIMLAAIILLGRDVPDTTDERSESN